MMPIKTPSTPRCSRTRVKSSRQPLNTPPPTLPRLIALKKKAGEIKDTIAVTSDEETEAELIKELSKVNQQLADIMSDPLTNDYCIDEPWAIECKMFD